MRAREFDWLSGEVTFWDMDSLDRSRALSDQRAELKEDLAQIEYPYDVTLDVGWYPDDGGAFMILVVCEDDWEHPKFRRRVSSLGELGAELNEAIQLADQLATESASSK